MKNLSLLFSITGCILIMSVTANPANRYSVAIGNWNSTSTWAATSGGSSGASVPAAGDVVFITYGNNVTVNISNAECLTLWVDGRLWFGTGSQITVSGDVSLGTGTNEAGIIDMSGGGTLKCESIGSYGFADRFIEGTGTIELTAINTLPENDEGNAFGTLNNLTISGGNTTLGRYITVNGTLTFSAGNIIGDLTLGLSATITGEVSGCYLVGALETTRTIGAGSSSNFCNIGLTVGTGVDNLGDVYVTRTSGSAPSGTGSKLNRWWSINSGNPPTNGRDITFSWISDDDGDVDLSVAVVFVSSDYGASWNSASPANGQNVSATRTITATGVTEFPFSSYWTVGDATSPLPVELSAFTVSIIKYTIQLNWVTVTEVHNFGFEVERSTNKINWSKIAFVNGHGNSNSPKHYSYTDSKFSSGKYYYRLKQIDNEGAYKYSDIIEVEVNIPKEYALSQNYPNPFNLSTIIKYQLPERGLVTLKIFNTLGQEVAELVNETKPAGSYEIEFVADNLTSGVYIYQLNAGDFIETKKMVLMK
jgi:hypothetical protein